MPRIWPARASTWGTVAEPVTSSEVEPFRTTTVLLVIPPAVRVEV